MRNGIKSAGTCSTHWKIDDITIDIFTLGNRCVIRHVLVILVKMNNAAALASCPAVAWGVSTLFFKHYKCTVLHASCPMGPQITAIKSSLGTEPRRERKNPKVHQGLQLGPFLSWFQRGYPSAHWGHSAPLYKRTFPASAWKMCN